VDALSAVMPWSLFREWMAVYAIETQEMDEGRMQAEVDARMTRR